MISNGNFKLTALALAATAMFSCTAELQPEVVEPAGEDKGVVLEAVLVDGEDASSDSKVKLNSLKKIYWTTKNIGTGAADTISVNGVKSTKIEIVANTGNMSANFTFPEGTNLDKNLWALYPASCVKANSFDSSNGKYGTINLKGNQTFVAGGVDPDAVLMFAKRAKTAGTDAALEFNCGVAFLKLNITESGDDATTYISKIKVTALDGKDLSGDLTYQPGSSKLARTVSPQKGNTVTLTSANDTIPQNTDAYIAIAAQEYAGIKIDVTFKKGGATHTRTINSPASFNAEAGKVYGSSIKMSQYVENFSVSWDEWNASTHELYNVGSYPRLTKLKSGRMVLSFLKNGTGKVYTKSGTTFSALKSASASLVMQSIDTLGITLFPNNPEFCQLADGSIVCAVCLRPKDSDGNTKTSVCPVSIAVCYATAIGQKWSAPEIIYESKKWSDNALKGAFEPYVRQLSDGTIQVYFTDNTPYGADLDTPTWGSVKGNNITVMENKNYAQNAKWYAKGNWGEPRIVCHSEGGWDGMPVVARFAGRDFLVVEHKDVVDASGVKYPMTIQMMSCKPSDNWSSTIPVGGTSRFYPFVQSTAESTGYYRGAPYLVGTDNYAVISCQSAKTEGVESGSVAAFADSPLDTEVYVWPVSKISGAKFSIPETGAFNPFAEVANNAQLYPSLCDLGNDTFCCVASYGGKVYYRVGTIAKAE